jgi:hypothetical protein
MEFLTSINDGIDDVDVLVEYKVLDGDDGIHTSFNHPGHPSSLPELDEITITTTETEKIQFDTLDLDTQCNIINKCWENLYQ